MAMRRQRRVTNGRQCHPVARKARVVRLLLTVPRAREHFCGRRFIFGGALNTTKLTSFNMFIL